MKLAQRLDHIEPFYVMECAKAALAMAKSPLCDPQHGGRPMIFLNIGEPDFTAPPLVLEAAQKALRAGHTQYTPATGLPALRERIAAWYQSQFSIAVDPDCIVVTAGASAALQLACLALINPGDEVLLPDPSYPCNRHFVAAAGGVPLLLPTNAATRYQPTEQSVLKAWTPRTRGVLLATPSNPTGTSVAPKELASVLDCVGQRGGFSLVDEIYLGLSFDPNYGQSALALSQNRESLFSINSFSKYFSMTGWRLGWLVVPKDSVAAVEKLAQNLYICPSAIAQHAALACFESESLAEFERRKGEFKNRRDYLVPALSDLGLTVPVMPDGAFYAWADCSAFSPRWGASSWEFAFEVLRQTQVAITPGRDFGPHLAKQFVRLSFANSMTQLEEAVARLARMLSQPR
jgi:aspartate/methionine/tyrosine aminotransferase